MSVKLYKELIDEMIKDGIKVETLKLIDIKGSISLYKMFKNK
ncbi:hypothetical protein [uncultured Clostridium sp.]|nr:hypothetical protein [uncultured Clostridium sp.]